MNELKNSYKTLPNRFYQQVTAEKFDDPELIAFNKELANELGLDFSDKDDDALAKIFSGQSLIPGSEPIAQAYAAHQFGHFVPELGDGRAVLLGDVADFDIQLKGSGRTRFSRQGDGRSALGPVIREYILSEAMNAHEIPTTRALAAVATNEEVVRDGIEPGGIFTRVAPSHIRVGTFQYFATREDTEGLEALLNFSIKRHYPEIQSLEYSQRALAFIEAVALAQAKLIAKWMSVGFIHGVMNTDNFSIGGFTLDYGPCAFMDEFNYDKVFSSIDRNGRYRYSNQPQIGQWNILRLSECLIPLIDQDSKIAIAKIEGLVESIFPKFEEYRWSLFSEKFGIKDFKHEDIDLMKIFLDYLEENQLDFTSSFYHLPELYENRYDNLKEKPKLLDFVSKWQLRVPELPNLSNINPWIIPRNHHVQIAIERAYTGNFSHFHQMVEALKSPFTKTAEKNPFSVPPKPEERVLKTFCGT